MKKIIFAALLCMLIMAIPLSAADVTVDGVKVIFTDADTVIKDGRTLTPLRAVAEAMQADVQWNEGDKSIVLTKTVNDVTYGGTNYDNAVFVGEMQLGSFTVRIKMLHNGAEVYNVKKEMDIRAQAINGHTYVPARYLGYALGYETEWKDNAVCFRNIKTQNTWFTVDKSVKFPTVVSSRFQCRAYLGYGSVIVADADYGTRTILQTDHIGKKHYTYSNDAWDYTHFSGSVIVDSDRFNVDLSDPLATLENIKSAYEDIASPLTVYVTDGYSYRTLEFTRDITRDGALATLTSYYQKPKIGNDGHQAQWCISSRRMPIDCSHYLYQNSSGEYVKGFQSIFPVDDGNAAMDALLLLHTLLNETGERIWQMMSDYYSCSGYQAKTEAEYVSSDFKTPPIDKSIPAFYGLRYKSQGVNNLHEYELTLADEVNGNPIKIAYMPVNVNPGDVYNPRYRFSVYF